MEKYRHRKGKDKREETKKGIAGGQMTDENGTDSSSQAGQSSCGCECIPIGKEKQNNPSKSS